MQAVLLLGYTCYVLVLSPFTINFTPLRVAEDVVLAVLAALTCFTLQLDYKFYKEGQFLMIGDDGHAKSCKSRFL